MEFHLDKEQASVTRPVKVMYCICVRRLTLGDFKFFIVVFVEGVVGVLRVIRAANCPCHVVCIFRGRRLHTIDGVPIW